MTTKYGIRHYTDTGVYMAFKETFFLGMCVKREWIGNDGSVLDGHSAEDAGVQHSAESARNNIRKYFNLRHKSKNQYVDEYVYKEEWWEE